MAISIFPSTAAEFVSNNFVIDMNDTANNTADTGGVKQAGPYSMSFSSGDSSFDVYLIDEDGASVGYSNSTSITASGLFSSVVILGVATDEIITFNYSGSVNNADGEGDEPGAGAYLESISPTDLPSIDDTATVTGGNFGADTEIKFESGATVLDAKNITVNNSTELIVTRPDNLDADLDPWTLRAITTGVAQPTGTNANILTDAVTAGAVPSWVTTSPLTIATINTAYSETLEATDADGAVTYSITSGSLPTGLSLDSSTGVIAGTPTAGGQTFTVRATDDGGNTATREFDLGVAKATGGTIVSGGDGKVAHIFDASDDFEPLEELTGVEYVVVAGGGGSGNGSSSFNGGSGGAGGYRSSVSGEPSGGGASAESTLTLAANTPITITIGAGGAGPAPGDDSGIQGNSSSIGSLVSTVGGGFGGGINDDGGDGGSGGGGGQNFPPGGSGTAGEGFDGGAGGGGGGGAAEAGSGGNTGGDGVESSITGTPVFRAGGGNGGLGNAIGGGGNHPAGNGKTGQVILRYA